MRPTGVFKRSPYAFHFNGGISALQLSQQKAAYRKLSKADLFDVFADLWRQSEGEDKNVKDITDEILRRRDVLKLNDCR